ncbi:hypothetical protein [Actinomadura sp. 6K520]|uniref:hypothetical protein n=1 Tax=Actinomadura sp. 6K520 TaxID=2530364 RepID=UPI001052455F|nr:hypothetical protein [Actinomadura sp. 6K520]TDE35696.1 hypothetical protein E1289_07440 [Actinomadura sp. 6K520]
MELLHWATIVAFLSTGACFVGMAFLKTATNDMPPLHGARPFALAAAMLSSPTWAIGLTVIGVGFGLQFTALTVLPLSAVQPAMLAGLAFLPLIAGIGLGERLGRREAVCMALGAAAIVLYARAAGNAYSFDQAPAELLLLAAISPSLALPAVLFLVSDLRRKGAHERPLSGITYGISTGMLIGAAEVALMGMATLKTPLDDLAVSPNPYLFIVATALAAGQIQIAFQRCRLLIVGFLVIMTANPQMLLVSTALYGHGWEPRAAPLASLAGGLLLNFAAIWFLPRHERARPTRPSRRISGDMAAPPAPGPDPNPRLPGKPSGPGLAGPESLPAAPPEHGPYGMKPPSLRDRIARDRAEREAPRHLGTDAHDPRGPGRP